MIVLGERIRALGSKQSFWSLVDQGVVSSGNFVTNILLARILPPGEYGVYAILLGVVFFLSTLQNSLLVYPLLVKGATVDPTSLRRLTSSSLILTAALALPLGVTVLIAAGLVGRLQLGPWVLGAVFFGQLQQTLRGAFMADLRYREVLWGDALSYQGQPILILALAQMGQPSLEVVFGAIALTSGVAGLLQLIQLGLRVTNRLEMQSWAKDSWGIGSWLLLSNLTTIFTIPAFSWALAFFHGSEKVAAYEAVGNLLKITNPVMAAVINLIVPAAAQARLKVSVDAARRVTVRYGAQFGALLLPYYIALLLWPREILEAFYGPRSAYLGFEVALRLYVLCYTFTYVAQVLGAFLLAIEKSRSNFLSQIASTLTALSLGLPLTAIYGVMGGMWGGLFAVLAKVVASVFFLRRI